MKWILIVGGAAALAFAGSLSAKPGNGHGYGHRNGYEYDGGGGCPPGLAKKHNGCMPPGQARKLLRGQRFPHGLGMRYGYRQIPYGFRTRYGLSPYDTYYYSHGYIYRVDPRTMVVEQVIRSFVHP